MGSAQPILKVVRGELTGEEAAALTIALLALRSRQTAPVRHATQAFWRQAGQPYAPPTAWSAGRTAWATGP